MEDRTRAQWPLSDPGARVSPGKTYNAEIPTATGGAPRNVWRRCTGQAALLPVGETRKPGLRITCGGSSQIRLVLGIGATVVALGVLAFMARLIWPKGPAPTGGSASEQAVGAMPGGRLQGQMPPDESGGGPIDLSPVEMVRIPPGTFSMGSPKEEPGRKPVEIPHEVTLTRGFWIGVYEVTQEQYQAVMGANPSRFKGARQPVEQVTWHQALEFCNRLSQRDGLQPAYQVTGTIVTWDYRANGYRLPTEAEWECACRAGTAGPFHTGQCVTTREANYDGRTPDPTCSGGDPLQMTWDVGSGAKNAWGLYDMHGNVWEWCWDRSGEYPPWADIDPHGPTSGPWRIVRGGGWIRPAAVCRSANRGWGKPTMVINDIGFRIARNE